MGRSEVFLSFGVANKVLSARRSRPPEQEVIKFESYRAHQLLAPSIIPLFSSKAKMQCFPRRLQT